MKGVCGDDRNLNAVVVGCLADEGFHAAYDFTIFTLRQRVIVFGILHFADGADTICTVNDQVDLYGRATLTATPRIILMGNGIEMKATDYLTDMPQADALEGKPIPCVLFGSAKVIAPEMLICDSLCKEVVMKQCKE